VAASRDEEKRRAKSDSSEAPSAREALERARRHASNALSEALAALHALIDAASLAANGTPADAHPVLRMLARSIDELAEQLASGSSVVSPVVIDAVLDALDAEIARWETRSEGDAEARPVLRAFLGVREILWEVGLRRERSEPEASEGAPRRRRQGSDGRRKAASSAPARRQRVQRLDVQG